MQQDRQVSMQIPFLVMTPTLSTYYYPRLLPSQQLDSTHESSFPTNPTPYIEVW